MRTYGIYNSSGTLVFSGEFENNKDCIDSFLKTKSESMRDWKTWKTYKCKLVK